MSFHAQSWKSYSSKLRHLQQYVYWTKLKPRRETLSYKYFETSHLSLVMHSHVYKAVRFVTGCSPTQQERTTWGPGYKNIVDFEGKKKKMFSTHEQTGSRCLVFREHPYVRVFWTYCGFGAVSSLQQTAQLVQFYSRRGFLLRHVACWNRVWRSGNTSPLRRQVRLVELPSYNIQSASSSWFPSLFVLLLQTLHAASCTTTALLLVASHFETSFATGILSPRTTALFCEQSFAL